MDGAATVARPERWLEAQSRARPDAGRAAILDALTRFLRRFDPVLRTRDDVPWTTRSRRCEASRAEHPMSVA